MTREHSSNLLPRTFAGTAAVQSIATPRDERRPTVFISYSHEDKEFAMRLVTDLHAV